MCSACETVEDQTCRKRYGHAIDLKRRESFAGQNVRIGQFHAGNDLAELLNVVSVCFVLQSVKVACRQFRPYKTGPFFEVFLRRFALSKGITSPRACTCGAAGAPCPHCNRSDPPKMPPGLIVTIDYRGPRN
jgi:hypothetical protein